MQRQKLHEDQVPYSVKKQEKNKRIQLLTEQKMIPEPA
mgnify:CR=1 FL=1